MFLRVSGDVLGSLAGAGLVVLLGSGDGASVWWTWRGGGLLVIPTEEPPGAESQGDDQHPDERNEQAGVVSPRRLRGLCRSRWSRGTVVARIRDAVHGRVAGCCSFLPPASHGRPSASCRPHRRVFSPKMLRGELGGHYVQLARKAALISAASGRGVAGCRVVVRVAL
mgnify:CR=1 FL=1